MAANTVVPNGDTGDVLRAVLSELRSMQSGMEALTMSVRALELRVANLEGAGGHPPLRTTAATTSHSSFQPSFIGHLPGAVGRGPGDHQTGGQGTATKTDGSNAELNGLVARCALDFLNAPSSGGKPDGCWCIECLGTCGHETEHHGRFHMGRPTDRSDENTPTVAAVANDVTAGTNVPTSKGSTPATSHVPPFTRQSEEKTLDGNTTADLPASDDAPLEPGAGGGEQLVRVEGTPIPLTALERNRAVEMLLTHPSKEGRWCTSDEATHDVTVCYAIHRRNARQSGPTSTGAISAGPSAFGSGGANNQREGEAGLGSWKVEAPIDDQAQAPNTVNVEDVQVPVEILLNNRASAYLLKHPTRRGRWCTSQLEHDPVKCSFVHRTRSADGTLLAPPKAPPMPSIDAPPTATVNVSGARVPVASLEPNAAVRYLLEHPGRQGRWCVGHGTKNIHECTFVHHRRTSPSHSPAGGDGTSPVTSDVPNIAEEIDSRRTRMFVRYDPDSDEERHRQPTGMAW